MAGDIPLVGQPFTVHEGQIVATVTCNCRPGNPPMMLLGVHMAAICKHCLHSYMVAKILYDDGMPFIRIGIVRGTVEQPPSARQ